MSSRYLFPLLADLPQDLVLGSLTNGKTITVGMLDGVAKSSAGSALWKDEYPSGPWVPARARAAPDLENVTIGGVETRKYAFNGTNTEERLSNFFEINHEYMETAYANSLAIEAHMHFMPSDNSAGNVKMFLDWCYKPVDGAPIAQTSLSFICEIAANSQHFHKIKTFGNLPDLGYTIGDGIEFTVRRDPSDPEDTYAADIYMDKVALHVPTDTRGSRNIYEK